MSWVGKQKMILGSPFGRMLPDALFLKWQFRLHLDKPLHLKHPETYNEKLQWLKIHDRDPLYVKLVDKLAVKQYVADRIGAEYVVPLLGTWDSVDEIDFDALPDSFVLKCTHDSGGVCVIRDKATMDREAVKGTLSAGLGQDFSSLTKEWPYKGVPHRIIAEQCLEGTVDDYKFFCFDGRPEYMFIATGREDKEHETCFDFYDMDFRHIDVTNGHPNAAVPPAKPENWEKMKELAATLSAGIPHVRVDFYEVGGRVYFGEFTFYHWSGFVPFVPDSLDYRMGELIKLTER